MSNYKLLKIYTNKNNSKYKNFINLININNKKINKHNIKVKVLESDYDLMVELGNENKILYRTRNPNIKDIINKVKKNKSVFIPKNNIDSKSNYDVEFRK